MTETPEAPAVPGVALYRPAPGLVREAIQLTRVNLSDVAAMVSRYGQACRPEGYHLLVGPGADCIRVIPGDWVIRNPASFWGYGLDILPGESFAATYEAAETTPGPSAVQSPQTAPRDGSAEATGPLAPHLPAIRHALVVAISETTYEAEAKDYRAALAALDSSGEKALRGR